MVANPALTGFTAPEAPLGPQARAGALGPGPAGPPAQGLHPLPADRDLRHRGQRRLGHAPARRRQPPLEPRAARQARPRPGAPARPATRAPRSRPRSARSGATATGLAVGTPVVGGGGDQPAGAVGNGIVRPGVVSATMGTSGVVFAHADRARLRPPGPAPARLPRGARAPGTSWASCSPAGGSFQWFRNELGKAEVEAGEGAGVDPYFLLTDEAALAGPGAEGLFFLPYLTGERTPHFDPDAKGAWVGLTVRHGRAAPDPERPRRGDLRDARQPRADPRDGRRRSTQIRLSGGGARNPLWRQIQADIYGHDVHTLNSTEGPAFGVALLAQVGTGGFATVPEACDATIRLAERTAVDPKAQAVLRPGLRPLPPALPGPPRLVRRDRLRGRRRMRRVPGAVARTSREPGQAAASPRRGRRARSPADRTGRTPTDGPRSRGRAPVTGVRAAARPSPRPAAGPSTALWPSAAWSARTRRSTR